MSLLKNKDWFDIVLEGTEYTKESPEFDGINSSLFENGDNEYNKNHKRKTGKQFEIIPYNDKRAKPFFNRASTDNHQKIIGEMAIESKTGTWCGAVQVTKNGILQEMYIADEFRGYGLGDRFVSDAIHKYNANTLEVLEDNYIAIDLYKKHGFKEYKRYTNGINKLIIMKLESNINEGEEMTESTRPKKCTECGSTEIGVFFKGEPIYQCKQCGKYLGTVPTPNYKKESSDGEVVEEGFKHNRNKFDRSLRNKNNDFTKSASEHEIIKNGYDPIPKKLYSKLSSDVNWIKSEFISEFNKIKNNIIIDDEEYQQLKFSDVVEINNKDVDVIYYLDSIGARCKILYQIFESNLNNMYNERKDWDDSMSSEILHEISYNLNKISRKIEKEYADKNSGNDKFRFIKYNGYEEGDLTIEFGLSFEMKLRKHVKESMNDELDNLDEFDIFVEGANLDIMKELHKAKKEDKTSLKKISKALNNGKYNDARKYYEDYKKRSERSINYIRSIDMTNTEEKISSMMYGVILFLNSSINVGCTALGVMIAPILGAGGAIYTISKFIYDVKENNKEKKNLQKNDITVGAYQALVSNKLKELESTIKYIDMVITEYEKSNNLYDKYKEESVNNMMNENINNDEIFEEGFKDFFKKIRAKIRMKTLPESVNIDKSKLSKYGYNDLSPELSKKLKSDYSWIVSEFKKGFDKIKDKSLSDDYPNVKYKDVITIDKIEPEIMYYKYENAINYCGFYYVYYIFIDENEYNKNTHKLYTNLVNDLKPIVDDIKTKYNKNNDKEKFEFITYYEYLEDYNGYDIELNLSFNTKLTKIYKESVSDNFSDFELDYIFGTITEAEYNKIKEENAIGQMLPQVPLNGETLSKTPDVESDVDKLNSFVNSADGVLKGEIDEFTKEYVIDPECEFDTYLEASIAKMANVVSNKINISPKNAKIIVKKAVLKAKCKLLSKQSAEDVKVVDAKKRLINEEQEYRKFMKNLDEETKKQVETVSKEIEKEVSDDIHIDDIDISDGTNKEEKKAKTKQVKKLSTKDDDQYISNIDQKLKSLEEAKPIKENNEENKDYTRRLKAWEDKKYNLEMKKAKLQANFIKEYTEENPSDLYSEDPNYSLIIEKQELEASLIKAQDSNNIEGIRKYENKLKSNSMKIVKESVTTNEVVILEAAPIEDEIKPIIDKLNSKGYHTKYSSPGHHHLRKVKDRNKDGVYSGKLYSDARLMFDDDYKSIPEAPKYWITRQVDNKVYLDVPPITYNPNDGSPDEAFTLWKDKYMTSLAEWAEEIRIKPGPKEGKKNDEPKEEVKEESTFNVDEELNMMMESLFGDLEIDLALEL